MRGTNKAKRSKYGSISLPLALLDEIDKVVEELGYWPSRAAFIREACLKMIDKHRAELETRRSVEAPPKKETIY